MTGRRCCCPPANQKRCVKRQTGLRAGGLVAFPTDTVYGLGALVWNEASIARIYAAKERPPEKAIPILLSSLSEAHRLVGALPAPMETLARRFWPGPLTLVVPCGDRVPDFITSGSGTVALRVPNHPVTLQLLSLLGQPLAVTSANRSGLFQPLDGTRGARSAGRADRRSGRRRPVSRRRAVNGAEPGDRSPDAPACGTDRRFRAEASA